VTALAPLEVAVGFALHGGDGAPLPTTGSLTPLEALEAAIVPSLQRPPCLVSFSGGRDSSAVLAVAVRAARRAGLEAPIPATIRLPAAPEAEESLWQERVIAHLGLDDWLQLEVTDELDAVGPIARGALRRHGLLWPFNAHFHVPLLQAAHGGALVTGIGGDELFAAAMSSRAAAVLAGRVRPVPRDVRRLAFYAAPRPLRRWWHGRDQLPFPWLTTAGSKAACAAFAALDAAEPRRLAARMAWLRGGPALTRGPASLIALAADAGAAISHPLLDRGLWAAIARTAPNGGYLGRTHAMKALFGGLLPDQILERSDKAGFDEVFFARHSRALAAAWNGEGAPADLVDLGRLRAHWAAPNPRAQSYMLLQAAFLASSPERVEQQCRRVGERVPAARATQAPYRQ
jgi:asparagine synthase (glutamine-hydrolysing)